MIKVEIRLLKLLIVISTISFRLYPQLDITIPLNYDDFGTTVGYLEAANMQLETTLQVANSLKSRISFNSNSGNNNGILIPMHTPLGSFRVNIYIDTPIFNIQKAIKYPVEADGKEYKNVSNFKFI